MATRIIDVHPLLRDPKMRRQLIEQHTLESARVEGIVAKVENGRYVVTALNGKKIIDKNHF